MKPPSVGEPRLQLQWVFIGTHVFITAAVPEGPGSLCNVVNDACLPLQLSKTTSASNHSADC